MVLKYIHHLESPKIFVVLLKIVTYAVGGSGPWDVPKFSKIVL